MNRRAQLQPEYVFCRLSHLIFNVDTSIDRALATINIYPNWHWTYSEVDRNAMRDRAPIHLWTWSVISSRKRLVRNKFTDCVHCVNAYSADILLFRIQQAARISPTMADRDIPSVPITTLAGLASVSDCKLSTRRRLSTTIDPNHSPSPNSACRATNIRIIGRKLIE